MKITLDLGCGQYPKNPYNADYVYGIDIVDFGNKNIKKSDLIVEPIPFDDNIFDYVTGFDFLEHIPRVLYNNKQRSQPFIDLMSEVWRVLKPNGKALFYTPAYPHPEAFQDPQHVNIITEYTVSYFCRNFEDKNKGISWNGLASSYGFKGQFDLISQLWDEQNKYHLVWELLAIK